jgi:alkanesulfonate monooxygenase SsuD/methylene tetrahydromethanopterin reductase-like flavin-dependent oxidoreductase (luciferase family)
MPTPGLVLFSTLAPGAAEATVTYTQMAEARGFRSVLVSEAGTDALAMVQHLASVTTRVQVGTCITNIYLRPPLLAALHALTIDRFAPGRLLLGLGVSTPRLNQAYGLAMEKPTATLRQYLTTLTAVLRGEHAGLQQLTAAGRAVPRAEHPIPVYVGGVGPKNLAVTGELADGSFVSQCAPQGLEEIRTGLARGAQRAGQQHAAMPIVPLVHCCVCADRAVALRSVRRVLASYGQIPLYNRFFARQGFAQEAAQLAAAAARGDQAGAEAAVSEAMAEQVAALGTAQDCQKKVEELERAGAAYVLLLPTAIDGDYDRSMRAVLDAFAR